MSPAAVQSAPAMDGSSGAQIRLPGAPRQVPPVQQSSLAVQGAPSGAQTLRQESAPLPSGRQWPPQHCSESAHG
jgi:hypothetical protein